MGTRGLLGLVVDGEVKATYNHWDSYPTGLGIDLVSQIRLGIDVDKARALVMVSEDEKPTAEQIKRLEQYANTGVSTGSTDEWYVLLHKLQGDLIGSLDAGCMIDSLAFAADSLFCEWGYLVNLDTQTLEVYRGFVQGEAVGRFAEMTYDPEHRTEKYGPITLLAEIPFALLDVSTEVARGLMHNLEKSAYPDDE